MKIIEVLEKTKELDIKTLAKELEVAQRPLSAALKGIGAEYSEKKKSWVYDNVEEELLQQDIYLHVPKKGTKRSATQEVNKEGSKETKKERNHNIINTENKPTSKPGSKELKKVTYEIEEELHDELKIKAIRERRKVSEIVNEMIKQGLRAKKRLQ